MNLNQRPALFLDRDGVINVDKEYVSKPEHFTFIDGIFELCRMANRIGYLIIVVTNQAGIGRGYYTENDFLKLTDWMTRVFKSKGVVIDKVYFCPFHPEYGIGHYKVDSPCRKPAPGMIYQAVNEFDVDLVKSVLVGDKETDIQAGIAAGVGRNLLYMPNGLQGAIATAATAVVENISDIKQFIVPSHIVPVER